MSLTKSPDPLVATHVFKTPPQHFADPGQSTPGCDAVQQQNERMVQTSFSTASATTCFGCEGQETAEDLISPGGERRVIGQSL